MPDFINTAGFNPLTALWDFTTMMITLILGVSGFLFYYYRRR